MDMEFELMKSGLSIEQLRYNLKIREVAYKICSERCLFNKKQLSKDHVNHHVFECLEHCPIKIQNIANTVVDSLS